MGLDVFLCKLTSAPSHFDRQSAIDILFKDALDPSYLGSVEYPDGGGGGEIYGLERDDEEFDSLMFAHFGGPTFLARIFELADRLEGFLFWTTDPAYGPNLGVTKDHLAGLVEDDTEMDGEVAILRDADHLNELMGGHKMMPMVYINCG